MVKVKINQQKLNQKLHKAFEKTCADLGNKMTEIIEREGAYSPPFPSGRDIVDTGALKESQSIEFISPTHARFSYGVEYAIYVHEGYTLRNGQWQPGRPWAWDAVDEQDLSVTFANYLED